ncbi:MAG: 30S ribosomal protein S4e [Fervidicoccaceae archaeon]
MARMGGTRHLKPYAAPSFWPIPVKERPWTVKPSPGPHSANSSIPLLLVVRDLLGYATSAREARRIISSGLIRVDGVARKDYKFPVGPMDVIQVVPEHRFYRVIPDPTKFLKIVEVGEDEASIKPLKIVDKTTVKGGHIQLHLMDGRNVLIRVSDPRKPVEDVYETRGTLVIKLPSQEIVDYIPLQVNNYGLIMAGRNVGKHGRIAEIRRLEKRKGGEVTLVDDKNTTLRSLIDYVLVVGRERPLVTL